MSHDALMRWEWEGGAPTSVREQHKPVGAKPAENAKTQLPPAGNADPTNRARPSRRGRDEVATHD
jgi:hypothetical protein